ncbi:deoxythymidylate kinase [Capsaspora owczarzaki ATCC 30864]|uniref:Thymidylate kinase n=1 Tax=Capsaspora owczarzaki (strain ATCC 30864) TaxID=595528 RepID=A0A0D2WR91_CAPO3|nr:deoxythymidylate kinase [Capsaspora owczarzaki ATCC 30864]KJE93668.1 deoxythymidylate kinase [Capsaspora owczarzaki ATCC 30864]|eukprot:XP_004348250.1 deoxythymidylate kinase [Capsaspora owczarzaki ATCC 30864]
MSTSSLARGALIVFEGCDRSGKSTQCLMLVERLKALGKRVQHLRFPDRSTPTGQKINAYLANASEMQDDKIHQLFSENRWEAVPSMLEALKNGTTLVVDRYAFSGVAFSSAKGLDLEWCKKPDAGLPAPDAVIYLDIPIEAAMKRGDFGNERYETRAFQEKVAAQYKKLQTPSWMMMDARLPIDQLQADIFNIASKVIADAQNAPVGKLW